MPTFCLWSVSLWISHFLPVHLSLTEFFLQWEIENMSFIRSWNQVCVHRWKTMGFGQVQVPATWVQVPGRVLARYEFWPFGFESQSKVQFHMYTVLFCPVFHRLSTELSFDPLKVVFCPSWFPTARGFSKCRNLFSPSVSHHGSWSLVCFLFFFFLLSSYPTEREFCLSF